MTGGEKRERRQEEREGYRGKYRVGYKMGKIKTQEMRAQKII